VRQTPQLGKSCGGALAIDAEAPNLRPSLATSAHLVDAPPGIVRVLSHYASPTVLLGLHDELLVVGCGMPQLDHNLLGHVIIVMASGIQASICSSTTTQASTSETFRGGGISSAETIGASDSAAGKKLRRSTRH